FQGRLHLRRFARGGFERFRKAKAERGDSFGLGLALLGLRGCGVDARGHRNEELACKLEIRILRVHAGERSGAGGRLARTKNTEPSAASSASTVKPAR